MGVGERGKGLRLSEWGGRGWGLSILFFLNFDLRFFFSCLDSLFTFIFSVLFSPKLQFFISIYSISKNTYIQPPFPHHHQEIAKSLSGWEG